MSSSKYPEDLQRIDLRNILSGKYNLPGTLRLCGKTPNGYYDTSLFLSNEAIGVIVRCALADLEHQEFLSRRKRAEELRSSAERMLKQAQELSP